MPTPTERLELRRQLLLCRVCGWLNTLDDKARKEWQDAIMNPRYGPAAIANEIALELGPKFNGRAVGKVAIQTHRERSHR